MAASVWRMKVSANEVMTLATKAARGAGAPPAQAADFGRAAVRHLIAGRAPQSLTDALAALPEGPILSLPLAFARLMENAKDETAEGKIKLDADPDLTQSYAEAQPFATETSVQKDALAVRIFLDRPNTAKPVARVDLSDDLAFLMQNLAARILVPESEASRRSGAGAGLTDND
ncbi:hypothetical protein AB2B41_06510 [Marimonas sp. MJW-29]|uniref:DUF2589 domain-containing protein n=1 Tax=Sulfitobacter sediminis TaxID=3234186 RepID=A0ABV3RKX8_9RHOB